MEPLFAHAGKMAIEELLMAVIGFTVFLCREQMVIMAHLVAVIGIIF
jgi:hypothetical protein